jgi:hypothetical protein
VLLDALDCALQDSEKRVGAVSRALDALVVTSGDLKRWFSDAALLAQQAKAIEACFDQYIPAGATVALLQFPYDFNVGNHMMWAVAVDYLKERGAHIAYAAHVGNFDVKAMARDWRWRGLVLGRRNHFAPLAEARRS